VTGGTLQRIATGTVHVSRNVKPRGLTLCGQAYHVDGKRWIWSYNENENETGSCLRCMRLSGVSAEDVAIERRCR